MTQSRYREARTLVRRLCRLPREDQAEFRRKIARLREHFERFNVDVSELCQWLMGLRRRQEKRDGDGSFGVLGIFILDPSLPDVEADEPERDRWRLEVFDEVAGMRPATGPINAALPIPAPLRDAITVAAAEAGTPTVRKLFARLRALEPAHRLVLLKAAAEWVVARYQRGVENWRCQRAEWEKEKNDWEKRHPNLTPQIRDQFTDIFKKLADPDPGRPGKQGVRSKRPRICPHDRLLQNKDNCIYAGEKGHGPLCWKYHEFRRTQRISKHFPTNAETYIRNRRRLKKPEALEALYQSVPQCRRWFSRAWDDYLRALNINEETVLAQGHLPHCLKIGDTWENSQCEWNPHTNLCREYKEALRRLDASMLTLELEYREWRREYLAGPRKPSFRYPSSRELPMPKIFGAGFHEIDFDRSVLRLRLDDMPRGQWVEFGFIPWPRDYSPSKEEVQERVTSVHVSFVGTRARAGFRFDVQHRESRFGCTQDELDELRSRRFPRQAQDQQFLEAARERLLGTFSGDAGSDLRFLSVDLGETGAGAAVFQGRARQADVPLKIVKLEKLYDKDPRPDKAQSGGAPDDKTRGLTKQHVGRHLEALGKGTAAVAGHRQRPGMAPATADVHDFRGLKAHLSWMIRDWVRLNAAQVMAAAEQHQCDLIVFESLRGFRAPGYDKMDLEKKRWLAMFAYGRVRRKVTEKAVERGMRVVTVPYFKSSQFCSACGHEQLDANRLRKNKKKRLFNCECGDRKVRGGGKGGGSAGAARHQGCSCTAQMNSDANAARVLAKVFWGDLRLPQPEAAAN